MMLIKEVHGEWMENLQKCDYERASKCKIM
jgi:hypothetical protein